MKGLIKAKKEDKVKKNCVVYFEQGKNKFANFEELKQFLQISNFI